MEQWPEVKLVIAFALAVAPKLSVLLFTGWTKERLVASGLLDEMSQVSVVVAGPYIEKLSCDEPLKGSTNQEIIFLDNRIGFRSLVSLPTVEVHCEGSLATVTGFPNKTIRQSLMKEL